MSINSISIAVPQSLPIPSIIIKDPIEPLDLFLGELKKQCQLNRGAHFDYAEKLLKECIEKANSDPNEIARIKDAVDAFKGDLLEFLIDNNHISFARALIDLKIKEISNKKQSNILFSAIEKGDNELVAHLLKNGAPVDSDLWFSKTPLNEAIRLENRECVRLLLLAGADPKRKPSDSDAISGLEAVLRSKSLPVLLPLFFQTKKISKTDVDLAIKKIVDRKIEGYLFFNKYKSQFHKDFHTGLAKMLPPIIKGIPCYTHYVAGRQKAIQHFINPLIAPPDSIKDYVTALKTFVFTQSKEDPKFTIFIEPCKSAEGEYFPDSGNIALYLRNVDSLSSLSETPYPVLLHEICHKALDKLDWSWLKSPCHAHVLAAQVDISSLNSSGWSNCHPEVTHFFQRVSKYADSLKPEEYLVRVPEILYQIAQKDPTLTHKDIVKIAERDFPHLFKFYTEKFLPTLMSLNNKTLP